MHFFVRSLIIFTFGVSAALAEAPKLYKSYVFDAPLDEFSVGATYSDCSHQLGITARCAGGEMFLNHKFELALKFNNDRLASVMLMTPYDQQIYAKTMGALQESFNLIMLKGQAGRLDMIELGRESRTIEAFQKKLIEYESMSLSQKQLTYIFIEQPEQALRKIKSSMQAILGAPRGVRVAELMLFENKEGAFLALEFSLPALQLEKFNQTMKAAPKEEF